MDVGTTNCFCCCVGFPLESLDLSDYCHITDVGIAHIAGMHGLSVLLLSRTKLTDDGMPCLAGNGAVLHGYCMLTWPELVSTSCVSLFTCLMVYILLKTYRVTLNIWFLLVDSNYYRQLYHDVHPRAMVYQFKAACVILASHICDWICEKGSYSLS